MTALALYHHPRAAQHPTMMHSDKVYSSESELRADAAARKHRLMGATIPAARITVRSWSHAPAPLPVVPDWWAVSQEARQHVLMGAADGQIDLVHPLPSPSAWRVIVSEVCQKHGVSYLELCSHRRNHQLVNARHEAAYRLHTETTMSTPQIGKKLGGRDHTTILNSLRKFRQAMEAEAA